MKNDKSNPGMPGSVPVPNLKKRGLKGYFIDVRREMRHVTWPTTRETVRLTGVVLSVCGIVVVYLTLLSKAYEIITGLLFRGGV